MSETCINLQERFGRRYRIGWEADGATKAQTPREEWPWLMELLCRHGKVYPWGGELLQACSYTGATGAKLRRLPFVLHAKGGEETVIRFHVDHIEQVLAVLKPYRRRQVSEAEKERLTEMGERFRFSRSDGVQSDSSEISGAKAVPNDAEATSLLPTPQTVTKGAADAV